MVAPAAPAAFVDDPDDPDDLDADTLTYEDVQRAFAQTAPAEEPGGR